MIRAKSAAERPEKFGFKALLRLQGQRLYSPILRVGNGLLHSRGAR